MRRPGICLLAVIAWVQFAAPVGAESILVPRRQILAPCEEYFGDEDSAYRRTLIERFSSFHVTDGDRLGHHVFRPTRPGRDASQPTERVQLLDLEYAPEYWRRERWAGAGLDAPYWMMEVGFGNLADDARAMNALVSGVLLESRAPLIEFYSTEARTTALEHLNTLRWASHARVMKRYREHRNKKKYLGELDFKQFREGDRQNLNVDVFTVTREPVGWDASHGEVFDLITSTIQVSYLPPLDYLRPTLDGLLVANGEPPTAAPRLPFMERLVPEQRGRFLAKLNRDFRSDLMCEITRYINVHTPEVVVAQLLLNTFERARERGCTVILASLDRTSLRRFAEYGLVENRVLPTAGTADEFLAVLRVNDGRFHQTLLDLRGKTRGLAVDPY